MSNFGDVLGIAGMVAGGIGGIGAAAGTGFMAANTAATYTAVGTSLSNLGKSFYPRGY